MRLHPAWLGAGALVFLAQPALAGPCAGDIHDVEIALNAKLDAIAGRGNGAAQTTAAQLHRQPTPNSIAAAEAKVGDISDSDVTKVRQFIDTARSADDSGNLEACHKALGDARALMKL
jgi:hypothetical protein